ncbi:MAG: hypothetical protein ACXWPM_03720 [Bdellovibrionota bacterium]
MPLLRWILLSIFLLTAACGVKGGPMAPLPDVEAVAPSPTPSPKPAPSPANPDKEFPGG